jgi:hypothetical protein
MKIKYLAVTGVRNVPNLERSPERVSKTDHAFTSSVADMWKFDPLLPAFSSASA